MNHLQSIDINENTREELLADFSSEFPYTSTYAELDKYTQLQAPWHWHRTVELFYMSSGTLEYTTPRGKWVFPAGSGGFVNFNVLHTSRVVPSNDATIQLLHLFDPSFLSGEQGSRIERKYVEPLASSGIEVIPLYPDDTMQAKIVEMIREAFALSENEWGYEFRLREVLTRIWLGLFELARSAMEQGQSAKGADDRIKRMMVYVHEHYQEPITVDELAKAVHISRRACFRLFQDILHMTPVEYIRSYRLQKACHLLASSKDSVTQIAYCCGLGSSSYFGKIFREQFGCSPLEYRKKRHDCDDNRH